MEVLPGLKNFSLFRLVLCWLLFVPFIACEDEPEKRTDHAPAPKEEEKYVAVAPELNEDSVYSFIQQQVAFGPRVPSTKAHKQCATYLTEKLRAYGFSVSTQTTTVQTFDGKKHGLVNIIGSYKKAGSVPLLLSSHWDSRPFADKDNVDPQKPIDGANDGASGVAVLLEIARQIQLKSPAISVDIVFFDIEDYGQPNNSMYAHQQGTWCLGSQYWGKQAQQQGYKARYGILLDMVGGKNATFLWEYYSSEYARDILSKVWSTAATLGYGRYFLNAAGDPIQDDHYYMNELAGVPTIDIIQLDPVTQGFGYYHHRHADNMQSIDKFTLKAVGQTIMEVLYTEK